MNRPPMCATALLLTTLAALPARAQTPLVVGAVRDQHGIAIAGAIVVGRRGNEAPLQTTTDTAGTFALLGGGVVSVLVTCRYCGPAVVGVRTGDPVVVIVHRYDALASESPSSSDLENLPYGHAESAIALRPFTLLAQSSNPYPGSRLSDRGLSPTGSLLVDDGAPNYDIVDGTSPYGLIPAQFERDATLRSASDAYLYGDQAGGGTVDLDPFGSGETWDVATLGSDTIARAQIGSPAAGAAFGSFSNDEESRQRADVSANVPLDGDQSVALAAGTEQGRTFEPAASQFAGNFSFADATFDDPQLANLNVSGVLDRGDYMMGPGDYSSTAAWSDSGLSIGVRSRGPVSTFANIGIRASTGFDQPPPDSLTRIGATLTQTHANVGMDARGRDYRVTAGVGVFWIDYAEDVYRTSEPARAALAEPSLRAQLFPDKPWSVNLEDSGSFSLPTFLEQYSNAYYNPGSVGYERNALLAAQLTYTDQARLRVSFELASQNVAGASTGTITSTGLSAAWQIAPTLALRAWTMHVTDDVPAYGLPIYNGGEAPMVNAFWLTYEGGDGLRFDAIYRRDLLDGSPYYHFDGDLSGPIVSRLRWYAGVEDRQRRTFVDVGLRFGSR